MTPLPSRRDFLKSSGLKSTGIMVGLAALSTPRVHAAEQNTLKIALVGAGGRGRGAAINALSAPGPSRFVAIADVFEDRVKGSAKVLVDHFANVPGRVDLPNERRFHGFDAYKKAIDLLEPGDVVILATCPAFRPMHVEYAVDKGVHVFMEKPFATDSPGTRRIQAAARKADEKNIKIACGLMWRHCKARQEAVARIHDGEIGELIHLRGYRLHGPQVYPKPTPGQNEIAFQVKNFHFFDWAGGNVFIDYCIHNIDTACWAKNAWPVSCFALGGRSVPDLAGEAFDTYYQEFTFADGTHLTSHGRYRHKCFNRYSDFVHGTKGSGVLMDNLSTAKTRLFSDQNMTKDLWSFTGKEPNPYQVEFDRFFDAIRNDRPYNEGHRAAEANFAALLGRAAMNSGQIVTWDQIVASDLSLFKDIDNISFQSEAPLKPDAEGRYPFAIPGETVAF